MVETNEKRTRNLRRITQVGVIATAVLWIGWDVVAYLWGGNESTISRVITDASRDWPIIPLLVGIVLGHLFFSQTLPPRTP